MKKIFISILILGILLMIQANCYAKYKIEEKWIIANIQIDNTPPKAKIEYKVREEENKIEITLNASEEIKPIKGWEGDETKKVWKKQIPRIQEVNIVQIEDLSGNHVKIYF